VLNDIERKLLAAILFEAIKEYERSTRSKRQEARAFLLSEDAKIFCEAIGFDHRLIERKVQGEGMCGYQLSF
jgi:hypothetical protein